MATGYTSQLEEMNFDVPRWLKQRLIRAMGVCVTLRDEDWELSEKQIKAKLENFEDKDDYHERSLKEARRKLKAVGEKSLADFKAEYKKKREAAEKRFAKDLIEFNKKKAAHQKALTEIEVLTKKAEHSGLQGEQRDVVLGTLKFAKEQMQQTIEFDYRRDEPYKEGVLEVTFNEWLDAEKKQPLRDIEYHEKEIKKKADRFKDGNRADLYEAFVNFINKAAND